MISPAATLFRLRIFLLVLAILLFGGTVVELSLVKHWGNVVQLIPFALCLLGSIAAVLALLRPRRATLLGLRVCMGVIVCGSLFGIYEHFSNNIIFQREIKPSASMREVLVSAVAGGNPLLAPGTLAVAALLALAASYNHPALEHQSEEDL